MKKIIIRERKRERGESEREVCVMLLVMTDMQALDGEQHSKPITTVYIQCADEQAANEERIDQS